MAMGYNAKGAEIDTWGLIGTLTWAAIAELCTEAGGGEVYTLLSPDEVAKGQTKAPNGIDWASMIADFDALGGNVPVPTPPAPVPPTPTPPTPVPPTPIPPTPVTTVTLAQAQAWANAGLATNWPK